MRDFERGFKERARARARDKEDLDEIEREKRREALPRNLNKKTT